MAKLVEERKVSTYTVTLTDEEATTICAALGVTSVNDLEHSKVVLHTGRPIVKDHLPLYNFFHDRVLGVERD